MYKVRKKSVEIFKQKIIYYDTDKSNGNKNIYIQGGIHGNEVFSSLVCLRLVELLKEKPIKAKIRVVPFCNPFSYISYLNGGSGRFSETSKTDWNRIFSDVFIENSLEHHLALKLKYLSNDYNVIFDIHTPEYGLAHVYVPENKVELKTFSDLPHVISDSITDGSFEDYHASKDRGLVATIELPSINLYIKSDVNFWASRIYDEVTAQLNSEIASPQPLNIGYMRDLYSNIDGSYYISSKLGETVSAGEEICHVSNAFEQKYSIVNNKDSIPLCFRRRGVLKASQWAIRILEN